LGPDFFVFLGKIDFRTILITSNFIHYSVFMENSLQSLRTANDAVHKINTICNQINEAIAFCMEINSDKVADHSVGLTMKMDSEYVDRVVIALQNMKHHLTELKTHLPKNLFKSQKDRKTITHSLKQSADNLQELFNANNFFRNTYRLLTAEIQTVIDEVLNEIEVPALAA